MALFTINDNESMYLSPLAPKVAKQIVLKLNPIKRAEGGITSLITKYHPSPMCDFLTVSATRIINRNKSIII